jgi:tRNA(fMet)-specific endonuclease VapC
MIVADTDVLIDFQKGHGAGADAVAAALEGGRLATTAISAFELLSGARSQGQQTQSKALLEALLILPVDLATAQEAADLRLELQSQGLGLAFADSLIAGVCRFHRAPLLTRNRKHFERVPGLQLVEL